MVLSFSLGAEWQKAGALPVKQHRTAARSARLMPPALQEDLAENLSRRASGDFAGALWDNQRECGLHPSRPTRARLLTRFALETGAGVSRNDAEPRREDEHGPCARYRLT